MIKQALWLICLVAVAAENRVICPEDASVFGYMTIDDLNQDMKKMVESGENQDFETFVYRLCPHTVFDGGDRLTPLLNNSHFICGADGDPRHRCTISGGRHQIYLADNSLSNLEYVSFRGITLSDSDEYGVAAHGQSGTIADFFDCQWVDGHGVSGIHIQYEAYVENSEGVPADGDVLYPQVVALESDVGSGGDSNETDNLFSHRRLTGTKSGMTVRIYNSTFTDIHQYGFQAVSNAGNLYMYNVTMKNIQASVLTNMLGGNATIDSCHFESIDAVSLIRAINSSMVMIHDSSFVENVAVGVITAIDSNVSVSNCQFINNHAPRGGQILAFASTVGISDSCIIDSMSMASVFRSSTSRLLATNVYGRDLLDDFCPGILAEDEGSSCFSGGECTGQCESFTGSACGTASAASSIASMLSVAMLGFLAGAVAINSF